MLPLTSDESYCPAHIYRRLWLPGLGRCIRILLLALGAQAIFLGFLLLGFTLLILCLLILIIERQLNFWLLQQSIVNLKDKYDSHFQ